jgi:predicted DNA-binding helix-hairpin-helix protein
MLKRSWMNTLPCERNCLYCPFRAGRSKTQRVTFSPDEMAGAFDSLQRANQVQGMFLSSGIIKGSVITQDKIIDTAETIRNRYHYRGYLHLKVMPGIEYDQLYRLMQLASTVTQFVVGAVGDTDQELLSLSKRLYRHYGLTRAYSSGFRPVIQTPFENLPATDPQRHKILHRGDLS